MQKNSLIAGVGVFTLLAGLAGADYWFKERYRPAIPEMAQEQEIVDANPGFVVENTKSGTQTTIAITSSSSVASEGVSPSGNRPVVKKGISTKKRSNVNIEDIFVKLQLIPKETTELSLLKLIDQSPSVQTVVLLRNNDRAFLFSWIENDEVKTIFSGIKKALQEQFSGLVQDLIDETTTSASGTPMDRLSFLDPAISKERIIFLRIRNRLYEVHIAKNGEGILDQLIEELGK